MDDAYFQKLADTAIATQEIVKIAEEGNAASNTLIRALMAAAGGGLGGGLLGYASNPEAEDLEKRVRRGALMGSLAGLGGYGGYKALNAQRAAADPEGTWKDMVPDAIRSRAGQAVTSAKDLAGKIEIPDAWKDMASRGREFFYPTAAAPEATPEATPEAIPDVTSEVVAQPESKRYAAPPGRDEIESSDLGSKARYAGRLGLGYLAGDTLARLGMSKSVNPYRAMRALTNPYAGAGGMFDPNLLPGEISGTRSVGDILGVKPGADAEAVAGHAGEILRNTSKKLPAEGFKGWRQRLVPGAHGRMNKTLAETAQQAMERHLARNPRRATFAVDPSAGTAPRGTLFGATGKIVMQPKVAPSVSGTATTAGRELNKALGTRVPGNLQLNFPKAYRAVRMGGGALGMLAFGPFSDALFKKPLSGKEQPPSYSEYISRPVDPNFSGDVSGVYK